MRAKGSRAKGAEEDTDSGIPPSVHPDSPTVDDNDDDEASAPLDHVQFLIADKPEDDDGDGGGGGGARADQSTKLLKASSSFGLPCPTEPCISQASFCDVLPFHILFNRRLEVLQTGATIARLCPALLTERCRLDRLFTLMRPRTHFRFDTLLSHINTITVLRTREGLLGYDANKHYQPILLRLKGQLIYVVRANMCEK